MTVLCLSVEIIYLHYKSLTKVFYNDTSHFNGFFSSDQRSITIVQLRIQNALQKDMQLLRNHVVCSSTQYRVLYSRGECMLLVACQNGVVWCGRCGLGWLVVEGR